MRSRSDFLRSSSELRPGDPITSQFLVEMARKIEERGRWSMTPGDGVSRSASGKTLQPVVERSGFWAMITGYDKLDSITAFSWQEAMYAGKGKWVANPSGRSSYYEKNSNGKTILRQPAFVMSVANSVYLPQGSVVWLERNHGEKYFAVASVDDSKNVGQDRAIVSERMIFDWHSGGCYTNQSETKASPRTRFFVQQKGDVPRVYLPKQEDYPARAAGINLYISAVNAGAGGGVDDPLYLYKPLNNLDYVDLIAPVDTYNRSPIVLDGSEGTVRETHTTDPTTAPVVDPVGGGRNGGGMLPGAYWIAYTFCDVPGWIDVTVSGCSTFPTSSSTTDPGGSVIFAPNSLSTTVPNPLGGVEVTLGKRGAEYLYAQMSQSREIALVDGFTMPPSPGEMSYNPTLDNGVFPLGHVGGATPERGKIAQITPGTHYFVFTYMYDDGSGVIKESQPSSTYEYTTDNWGCVEFEFFPKIGSVYSRNPKVKSTNVYTSVRRGGKDKLHRIISQYSGNSLKYYGPIPLPPAPPTRNETGSNFNLVYPYGSRDPIVSPASVFFYYWNYPIPNPTVAAIVDPRGYGEEGGSLDVGTYSLRYTFVGAAKIYDANGQMIDTGAVRYGETEPGPISAEFKVSKKGWIPKVYLPKLPPGAVGYNIYITDHNDDGFVILDKKTTDFKGKCYFNIRESGGVYEVYTSAPGFQSNSGYVHALPCQNNAIGIGIKGTSGVCCDGGCVEPLPLEMSLTDGNKTITLKSIAYSYRDVNNYVVYNDKRAEWWGCYQYQTTGYGGMTCVPQLRNSGPLLSNNFQQFPYPATGYMPVTTPGTSVSASIVYRLQCPDGRRWRLTQYFPTNGYIAITVDSTLGHSVVYPPRWNSYTHNINARNFSGEFYDYYVGFLPGVFPLGGPTRSFFGTYDQMVTYCQNTNSTVTAGASFTLPAPYFMTDGKCVDVDSMFLNGGNWGNGVASYPAPVQPFQTQGYAYRDADGIGGSGGGDVRAGDPHPELAVYADQDAIQDAIGKSNQIPAYIPMCPFLGEGPRYYMYYPDPSVPATGYQQLVRDASGKVVTKWYVGATTGVFSSTEVYSDNYTYYYPYSPLDRGNASDVANGRTTYTCRPINLRFRFASCAAIPGVVTITESPSS
jgi:hypothetical protein